MKKIFGLMVIISIVANFFVPVHAINTEILYGNIDEWGISQSFGRYKAQVRMIDNDGEGKIYDFGEVIIVNGERVKIKTESDIEELFSRIPMGSFSAYCVENDEITVLNYSDVSVKAEFGEINYVNGEVTGSLDYEYFLNDCNVIVALYEGDMLVDTLLNRANVYSKKTDFDLNAEINKTYTIKAFFWDINELKPVTSFISTEISTAE